MCRGLLYLGPKISNYELLFQPNHSLMEQICNPKYMSGILNLAGYGMAAWNANLVNNVIGEEPLIYKSTILPFYDKNFSMVCGHMESSCILAHIRAQYYDENILSVSYENCHPFKLNNKRLVMCHNGELEGISNYKKDIISHIDRGFIPQVKGTTDSELIYALLMTIHKDKPDSISSIVNSINELICLIRYIRKKNNENTASTMNLFIADGNKVIALRYVFDYGHLSPNNRSTQFRYSSLWFTYGSGYIGSGGDYRMRAGKKKNAIIIASEPLTTDTTTWMEIPEYTILAAEKKPDGSVKVKKFWVDS